MTKKKITIKDVAKHSGMSIATVSQILNGKESSFNPDTVKKVMASRDELNYKPNYFAQSMIGKKSKTIGVLVPDITNPFFSNLIRGIESVLYDKNFITMLCNADLDEEKENEYLEELSRRGVDGFIIASSAISNKAIRENLEMKNLPFIVLDQKKAEGLSDAVFTDDFLGGQLAAKHLKELGHKNVAVVMPVRATANIKNRLEGFRSIYQTNLVVVDTELSKSGGREAVDRILMTDATAIFAINDEIAFGLYFGLGEKGKSIPDDYSIVGYDNVDMCEYVSPKLTTIAQPIVELGKVTAEILLERIETPDKERVEKTLPVKLIKRFSTTHLK